MEPNTLTLDQWNQIALAVRFFWGALGAAIFAAVNFYLAAIIIPSLVGSEDAPAKFSKLRLPFYLGGLSGITIWVVCLTFVALNLSWINDFFPRFWQ